MTEAPLLSVRHLTTEFHSPGAPIARAVEDVSFDVFPGQTVGLVGESGCGKTTTLMSILRLLPASGRITSGKVLFKDVDLLSLTEHQMRRYRWKEMAIIFQGAMSALNPVMKIGDQIREAMTLHDMMDGAQAEARVGELLEMVGIPRTRQNQYPHEYSGGMRQRAMIAMALACAPDLLFADEPTTALDVMIQAQILALLKKIQKTLGLSIVLVTHDLGVVAEMCDSVVVMYGGKVAESGKADQIYNDPRHPYTRRLLASFPDLSRPVEQLAFIPGMPPSLTDLPTGCRFHPRCLEIIDGCERVTPSLVEVTRGHKAACLLLGGPETGSP
jgi:oligopeptide/dipeptide ABC transporter ATP-binding protein